MSQSFVTNCPIPYHRNALINTAREATAPDGTPRNHSKLDAPTWVYQGRSYGAGSSVGLMSLSGIPADFQLSNYTFEEIGYNASVQCSRFDSTNLTIDYQTRQGDLGVYRLKGTLPYMTNDANDPIIAWCGSEAVCEDTEESTMFAWYATSDDQGKAMVGIKATAWYKDDFDNIICSLNFVPTVFNVAVNVGDQLIIVTANDTAAPDSDPTPLLVDNTVLSLEFLSKMSSSLYVSVLGDAFLNNLNNTKKSNGTSGPEPALRATEASFEAILDDILGVYGSGQIMINNETNTTSIQGIFKSYRIGKPLVHAFTLALNLLIISGILFEALRTNFWRDLPRYDMMDLKSTVTAASFGGKGVARKIQRQRRSNKMWTADPGDRKLGEIRVCLRQDHASEPEIILPDDLLLRGDEVGGAEDVEMDGPPPAPFFEPDPYRGATPAEWSSLGDEWSRR